MEAKKGSCLKVGLTSTEPSSQVGPDSSYTGVKVAPEIATGDLVSLYVDNSGEVRSNTNGGPPKTLFFVDAGAPRMWVFFEMAGRMAVRALVGRELYQAGEKLPPLWVPTGSLRKGDEDDLQEPEVHPPSYSLPESQAPTISEDQVSPDPFILIPG